MHFEHDPGCDRVDAFIAKLCDQAALCQYLAGSSVLQAGYIGNINDRNLSCTGCRFKDRRWLQGWWLGVGSAGSRQAKAEEQQDHRHDGEG